MPSFSAVSTTSSRLETHGRVHAKDQGTGMAVKRRFGDKPHFLIMYGNVQLHEDEGRYADLDRVRDGKPSGVGLPAKTGDVVPIRIELSNEINS